MKALSAEHTHYFNFATFLFIFLLPTYSYSENKSLMTEEDKAIAEMAKTIRSQSKDWQVPQNQHDLAAKVQAAKIFAEMQKSHSDKFGMPEKVKPASRTLYFASHSLGEEGLNDILLAAASTPDSLVVFRGVRDEKNFAQSIMSIQQLASRQTPMANVVIDPTLFRDHGISKVPTILYHKGDKTTEAARVAGLSSAEWLLSKVQSGKLGDFGVKGPLEDIIERDLIEVMQEKVAAIDWNLKKEEAAKRFWYRQTFINLPKAYQSRKRYIDPTIVIYDDLLDAEGNIIHPKGTQINPLDLQAFTQVLVVFDPQDQKQVDVVKSYMDDHKNKYSRTTYIVTSLDTTDGWASYKKITDDLDSPVFKLTSDVLSRFELEYVPAIVTAENKQFLVEEIFVE